MIFSVCTVSSAAETPTITVESVGGTSGGDVSVKVTVENNPGLWGMDLRIDYDKSAMTLTSVENGDFFAASEWTKGNLESDTYILSYEANEIEDITKASGTLAILNFTLKEGLSGGDYEVKASYRPGDIINISFEDLVFTVVNGKVTVAGGSTVLKGDVDGDGRITSKDLLALKKYLQSVLSEDAAFVFGAADVDVDGIVTTKDLLKLKRLLIGVE